MAGIQQPRMYRVFVIELILLVVVVFGVLAVSDRVIALSALCGGMIAVVPALYLGANAFRYSGARQAALIVKAFNRGESGKFILTLLGFSAVFLWVKPVNVMVLFISYSVWLVVHIVLTARLLNACHKSMT